jgi:flagellar biosynthesis/type III secretory pathway protein FliH
MSDFLKYQLAKAEEKAQRWHYEAAAALLENAGVRERLAEIRSQHEPLASLLTEAMSERDRLYAAAFYVVLGRLPKSETER